MKDVKAKKLSKWGMVVAVVWVIIMMVLKAIWGLFSVSVFGLSTAGILSAGAVIVILFTPVYRSIWIDKYLAKKE